jgi:kynurenine formamidase
LYSSPVTEQPSTPSVPLTDVPPAYAEIAARVRNWGRWGPDDQLGTLNLIDEAARVRAAASVRTGRAYPLGLPLSQADGIQMGFVPGRVNPLRTMIAINGPLSPDPDWIATSEDVVFLSLQCATHWDALAHASYRGIIYNGYPADSITVDGAPRCGIDAVRSLVSRGVLLDVARAKGLEVLEPGYAVTPDDLDAAAEMGRVTVEPGDVVLVRTGQMVHLALPGRPGLAGAPPSRDLVRYTWPTPGLTMATAEWFHRHDVAAVATDTLPLEVFPCESDDIYLPVHLLHLVEMGMTQGQNWFLCDLADACAEDGEYTFLLDATPLPFVGGLGSPLNPVALK